MIYLDAIWGNRRMATFNGKSQWIPFGVDLPSKVCEFLPKWINNSGYSWTAERMKTLYVWAIHLLAGNREYYSPWFVKIRYHGYWIPKLELFKLLIDNRNHVKMVRLILTVLKSYRLRIEGTPSLDSIRGHSRVPDTSKYVRLLRHYCQLPSVPKSVLEPVDSIDTRKSYCDDLGQTHPGPYGLLDESYPAEIQFVYQDMNRDPWVLGKLVPIPDKGKWRTILVGHWAIQLKTKRLADWLRSWLWTQPEVASGDQDRMSRFAILALGKGKTLLSIDLSQATDRLSADFQIQLLASMGVPEKYFRFLKLPAVYRGKDYGEEDELKKIYYSNGQPMGLFVSFPMFELMHYVILKYVTAITDADFIICGDDVMIACEAEDAQVLFDRYRTLIERFGGIISETKTIVSDRCAEGVGALFLKGYPKELRIPSGKLSTLEAASPGFWLNQSIKTEQPVGRAIHYSWLTTKEYKEFTYANRRALNERLVLEDLENWSADAVRALATHEDYPQKWYTWEPAPPGTGMNNPLFPEDSELPASWTPEIPRSLSCFKWVSLGSYRDALVTHKLISLYKKEQKEGV